MRVTEEPKQFDRGEFATLLADLAHLQHGEEQTADNDDDADDFRKISQSFQFVH